MKPEWLRKKFSPQSLLRTRAILERLNINTVCDGAFCPNIVECFGRGVITFLILGKICSRGCSFCAMRGSVLGEEVDEQEPQRIAMAVKELGIKHTIITSVTRDDLPDRGVEQFLSTFMAIKNLRISTSIEFVIPDFHGALLKRIAELELHTLTHNLETVPRLYPSIRPQFNYRKSLSLLEEAKRINPWLSIKSGIMVGLGETREEVLGVMKDLILTGCEVLTIGQYLPPSKKHPPPADYIHPQLFKEYEEMGKKVGFNSVVAGPFVRSSYPPKFYSTR